MDRRNLFDGFDPQLHFIRRNKSQRMFDDVYRKTLSRVLQTARRLTRSNTFSISDHDDYVQEGYRDLWSQLGNYKWVCECGIHFDTRRRFNDHGCCGKPRNTISQFATFVVCSKMRNYRLWHLYKCRDENKTTRPGEVKFETLKVTTDNPEALCFAKDALRSIRDLLYFEDDHRMRFVLGSFLDGATTRQTYTDGVDQGFFHSRAYARAWMTEKRRDGRFQVYVDTLQGSV